MVGGNGSNISNQLVALVTLRCFFNLFWTVEAPCSIFLNGTISFGEFLVSNSNPVPTLNISCLKAHGEFSFQEASFLSENHHDMVVVLL